MVHDNYCSGIKKSIQEHYVELTNLPVDSMLRQLYAEQVITGREKEMIENIKLKHKKMEYLLDSVIIPSLANNVTEKFTGFTEVMEKSDDLILINMAKKLGM